MEQKKGNNSSLEQEGRRLSKRNGRNFLLIDFINKSLRRKEGMC